MSEIFDDAAVALRADGLYAARMIMSEAPAAARSERLSIADLIDYLTAPQRCLTMDEQRQLFNDGRLRADLRRLRAELAVAIMPQVAAADSGASAARRFPGGSLKLHPSRVEGQTYVLVQLDDRALAPGALVIEGPDGDCCKRALPRPDDEGRLLLVLDASVDDDMDFLRIVVDPMASGAFLA